MLQVNKASLTQFYPNPKIRNKNKVDIRKYTGMNTCGWLQFHVEANTESSDGFIYHTNGVMMIFSGSKEEILNNTTPYYSCIDSEFAKALEKCSSNELNNMFNINADSTCGARFTGWIHPIS
jgi:hypothetical protein